MPNKAKTLEELEYLETKHAELSSAAEVRGEDLEDAVDDTRGKIEDLEAELASMSGREENQVDGYVERVEKLGEGREIPLAGGCADAQLLCEDGRDPYLILRFLSEDGEDDINVGLNVRHLALLADELNDN